MKILQPSSNQATLTLPFSQLQSDFLDSLLQRGLSPNTLKNYKTDLDFFNHFLRDSQTGLLVGDFDAVTGPQLFDEYLHQRYPSPNSRRRRVQTLRLFFDFLKHHNIFDDNPIKKILPSPKKLSPPKPATYSQILIMGKYLFDQVQESKKKASFNLEHLVSLRNQVIFWLILEGGLKVSDISELHRNHLSLHTPVRVMVTPRKNEPYSVPLSDHFRDLIHQYFSVLTHIMNQENLNFPHLFFSANPYKILNEGITSRGIEMVFAQIRQNCHIEITPKSLRQSAIFIWLSQGQSQEIVKKRLGLAPNYSLEIYQTQLSQNIYPQYIGTSSSIFPFSFT
jgi:site-specific recombinase XerD